ncbi:chymotrypsin-2-like [Chironomus tepperi]|uniref:chymotrypsin-2-like n=1 Tax=Chironomus tepperi TaxID=113505 RepID=UPI00391F90B7
MWKLILILSAISIADCKIDITPRIVGGNNAAAGQFPYFMSIRYGETLNHGCGSGILNTQFAITAAHCLNGRERMAVAGTVNLADPGVRYNIIQSIPHPNFDAQRLWHDIGVYKVDRDIVFTNLIKPIPLSRKRVIFNTPAVLAGHGAFTQQPPWEVHPNLQYLNSTTMSNSECILRSFLARLVDPSYNPSIHFAHICAFASIGVGGCYGDSGSPLVNRRNGEVMGVVVSGLSCARGAPDYYARVSFYARWIDANIIA